MLGLGLPGIRKLMRLLHLMLVKNISGDPRMMGRLWRTRIITDDLLLYASALRRFLFENVEADRPLRQVQ